MRVANVIRWTGFPGASALAAEALLEVFDSGLERGDVPLQLREIALEDFAPTALVGQPRFDAASLR